MLEVLDGNGAVIRRLSSEPEPPYVAADHPDADPEQKQEAALEAVAGFNRGAWDLTFEGARRIPGSTNDAGNVNVGPLVPPGDYRLRLTVADTRVEQPLTVLPDPRSDGNAGQSQRAIEISARGARSNFRELRRTRNVCAACGTSSRRVTRRSPMTRARHD